MHPEKYVYKVTFQGREPKMPANINSVQRKSNSNQEQQPGLHGVVTQPTAMPKAMTESLQDFQYASDTQIPLQAGSLHGVSFPPSPGMKASFLFFLF